MANYAKLDSENFVIDIHAVADEELLDENGLAQEQKGIDFLNSWQGFQSIWKQCDLEGKIRKNYPAIGFKYDPQRDAFISPKPFESWILDEETCQWVAPIPMPEPIEGVIWVWNESEVNWKSIKGMEI